MKSNNDGIKNHSLVEQEQQRAMRIGVYTSDCHNLVSNIYEKLVDREFDSAQKDIKRLIADLKIIIKSIDDDLF